jgi:hypothetical protein
MSGKLRFDLAGKRFGKLLVKERATSRSKSVVHWLCVCDCGNQSIVASQNLKNQTTKSCGCFKRLVASSQNKTHGLTNSPTYKVWSSMRTRCLNPKATNYEYYGARGVTICERWSKFENFIADMGVRPQGMTIDRINVNQGYSPENCRWASRKQQSQNRRKLKLINEDALLEFLKTLDFLTHEQATTIACLFFKGHK